MLTRQNNSNAKALRNTQKKGKAFRIITNAIIKKTARERDIAKATITHLLVDCYEAEDECIALKKRMKLEKHAMMRERVVKTRVCILTALVGVLQAAVVVYTYVS
jgi:hypothetical protein